MHTSDRRTGDFIAFTPAQVSMRVRGQRPVLGGSAAVANIRFSVGLLAVCRWSDPLAAVDALGNSASGLGTSSDIVRCEAGLKCRWGLGPRRTTFSGRTVVAVTSRPSRKLRRTPGRLKRTSRRASGRGAEDGWGGCLVNGEDGSDIRWRGFVMAAGASFYGIGEGYGLACLGVLRVSECLCRSELT